MVHLLDADPPRTQIKEENDLFKSQCSSRIHFVFPHQWHNYFQNVLYIDRGSQQVRWPSINHHSWWCHQKNDTFIRKLWCGSAPCGLACADRSCMEHLQVSTSHQPGLSVRAWRSPGVWAGSHLWQNAGRSSMQMLPSAIRSTVIRNSGPKPDLFFLLEIFILPWAANLRNLH